MFKKVSLIKRALKKVLFWVINSNKCSKKSGLLKKVKFELEPRATIVQTVLIPNYKYRCDIIHPLVRYHGRSRRSPAPPSGPLDWLSGPLDGPSWPLGRTGKKVFIIMSFWGNIYLWEDSIWCRSQKSSPNLVTDSSPYLVNHQIHHQVHHQISHQIHYQILWFSICVT